MSKIKCSVFCVDLAPSLFESKNICDVLNSLYDYCLRGEQIKTLTKLDTCQVAYLAELEQSHNKYWIGELVYIDSSEPIELADPQTIELTTITDKGQRQHVSFLYSIKNKKLIIVENKFFSYKKIELYFKNQSLFQLIFKPLANKEFCQKIIDNTPISVSRIDINYSLQEKMDLSEYASQEFLALNNSLANPFSVSISAKYKDGNNVVFNTFKSIMNVKTKNSKSPITKAVLYSDDLLSPLDIINGHIYYEFDIPQNTGEKHSINKSCLIEAYDMYNKAFPEKTIS